MSQAPRTSAVVNAMTVDVEDYFQVSAFDGVMPREQWSAMESRVVRNTERLLAAFAETRTPATFFVLGWVAERFPSLVRTIAEAGHEIASHGTGHRLVYDLTPDAFRDDVRRSKALLESTCGAAVQGYRAPSFSITTRSLWALDVLVEEGFTYDASIFPVHHDRYGIPSSPRHPYRINRAAGSLIETPASTTTIGPVNIPVAGGGYFRILPYAWTRWGIRRINAGEGKPVVFYLHPWEVDADQPRLAAGRLSSFRHYRNLQRTEPRLRRLLAEFRFDTMRALIATLPSPLEAVTLAPAERPSGGASVEATS